MPQTAPVSGSPAAPPGRLPAAAPPPSRETPAPRFDHIRPGVPVQFTEVVGNAAGANQQDAFLSQPSQRLADLDLQPGPRPAGQRYLNDRNARIRIHQRQRHPGAMIERSLRVQARLQQFSHPAGQVGFARRRILHRIQRRREAVEVVPGLWSRATGHQQLMAFPMRRHHHDRLRPWQRVGQPGQSRPAGARLQGEHGRTVGNEQAGQHGGVLKVKMQSSSINYRSKSKPSFTGKPSKNRE